MTKELFVGAAKLDISPSGDMFPLPLGFTPDSYNYVKEGQELSVRAIVVDNGETAMLFEAFELGGLPDTVVLYETFEKEFGLKKEQILFSATHEHSAPHPINEHAAGPMPMDRSPANVRYTAYLMEQAVEVVRKAFANKKKAFWGYGEGKSYLNINRDQHFDDGYWMQGKNWEGCSDKTLAVLKFVDEEGKLIAGIANYAMHSVMSFTSRDIDGEVKISCGIPGIACHFLEEHYGNDSVVLWQSGAAGNQNPYAAYQNRRFDINGTMYSTEDTVAPGYTYLATVSLGEEHAVDILRVMKSIDAKKSWAKIREVENTVYFPGQKFPEGVDRAFHRLMVDNLLVHFGHLKPGEPFEKKLVDMIPTDEKVPMRTQLFQFGDVAFYGLPCELYNEIAVLCKEASPMKHTIITTHTGPSIGYILDDASKGRKVFQSFGRVREGESNGIVVNGMLESFDRLFEE